MHNNIISLKKDFERIKKMGWVRSIRNDAGGIGITFEKLIGIQENCLAFMEDNP